MDNQKILASWPIRKKLLLLLLVIFLPASAIVVASGLAQRQHEIEEAHFNALQLVQSLTAVQEQIATGTRQMLSTLAHASEVRKRDADACNELFRDLQIKHPYYSGIFAVAPNGDLFAASTPFEPGSVNLSDRKHFQDTIRTLDFAVGEYIVGRITQVPTINYAYPVHDERKNLAAIVIVGFKLNEYAGFMKRVSLPAGSALTIMDHRGIRLCRLPETEAAPPGMPLPEDTVQRVSGDLAQGIFERTGQDGVHRIYAFKQLRLREDLPPYLYLIVGVRKDDIVHKANVEMIRSLLFLGFAALAGTALAWVFGNTVLVKPISRLVTSARRFGSGELSTRTDLAHTSDEMGQLAKAFDDMAALLEEKHLEREQAKAALCRSEETFSKAFRHAPLLMTISKVEDGTYLDVNEKFVQVSGFSREEIIGKTSVELGWISAADRDRLVGVLRARGRVDGMELTLLTKDKQEVHCLYNGELIIVDNHPRLLSIAQDITEHKQLEEEIRHLALKRAQEALERVTLQNKMILDAAGEGIIGLNRDGEVSFANPATARMLGGSVEELLGMPFHLMVHHTGADGTPNNPDECRICAAHHGGDSPKVIDEVFWRKDGTSFPIEYVSTPVFEQGERAGTVLVFQNISERQQWERELRQIDKMHALGTLAGGIAHDFNNILATMILNTEMAMDEVVTDSLARRNMERVLKAGNRARDLIEQILAFSRQSEQRKQPLDITPIVKETLKLLKATVPPNMEISLHVESGPNGSPALVLADPTQIHQVLMNLCTNGLHAMGENGGRLGIDIAPIDLDAWAAAKGPETAPGPYLMITVSDTGQGMEEPVVDRIFDPFFTTKQPGEGTGLGLSMAYGIVRSHGGTIRVESELGRGTTFEVLLPRIDAAGEARGAIEEARPLHPAGGTERILLVDDDEELLDTCRKMLDRFGYKVAARKNGREALEAFLEQPERFDLIITDQTMPEITGIELAERVLQIRPKLPMILITGYGEIPDFERARSLGIRESFRKPFDRKQLAEVIRRVLDG